MNYILYDHKELSGIFLDPSDNKWHAFMFKRCSYGWYISLMKHPSWNTFYRPVLGDMYCLESAQEELLREGNIETVNKSFIANKDSLTNLVAFMNRKYREITGDMQSPKPDVRMVFDPDNNAGVFVDSEGHPHYFRSMTYFEANHNGRPKLHYGYSTIQIKGNPIWDIIDSLTSDETVDFMAITDPNDRYEAIRKNLERREVFIRSADVRMMDYNFVIVKDEDIPKLIDFLNEKLQEKWNRN